MSQRSRLVQAAGTITDGIPWVDTPVPPCTVLLEPRFATLRHMLNEKLARVFPVASKERRAVVQALYLKCVGSIIDYYKIKKQRFLSLFGFRGLEQ